MKNSKHAPVPVTYLLILLAASCVFGAVRGEMSIVSRKAVNICMECIGIG